MRSSIPRAATLFEEAQLRLRSRFAAKFLGAPAVSPGGRVLEDGSREQRAECGAKSLEAARERLHARFLVKWPVAESATAAAAAPAPATGAAAPQIDHLEAARQRLHARFIARWPTTSAPAPAADFVPAPGLNCKQAAVDVVDVEAEKLRVAHAAAAAWHWHQLEWNLCHVDADVKTSFAARQLQLGENGANQAQLQL